MIEHHVRVRPSAHEHIGFINDQLSVEPVADDAIGNANPTLNAVQLEVGLHEMPVVLVARTRRREKVGTISPP